MVQAVFTNRPLSIKPISWVNGITRVKTKRPFDHVSILKDGVIYESTAGVGVHKIPFEEWKKGREGTTIFLFNMPEHHFSFDRFDSLEGVKYDLKANLLFLMGMDDKLKNNSLKAIFCSELLALMEFKPDHYRWTPGMLAVSYAEQGFNLTMRTI